MGCAICKKIKWTKQSHVLKEENENNMKLKQKKRLEEILKQIQSNIDAKLKKYDF